MRKKMDKDNYIYTYYQQMTNGSVVVSKWILLVYEYIVHGLESKLFAFDQKKANDAIDWIETHCFHTEGPLAPGPFLLEVWQKALISCIFGIVDINTGIRWFREVVLIIARKNGKTLLASAICNYIFQHEGGYGARVFVVAPKLEQADICYNSTWQMVQLDPEWQALKLAIQDSKDAHNKKTVDDSMLARHRQSDICIPGTNSTVKKIAFSAKKSDGFNPSLTVCDEIASWQGDAGLKQYEVMKSAMGAREMGDAPSILLSCSTAGYINDSIYDELIKRATAFLNGTSREKKLLPFLYMIDDIQKWNDINELRKSNPNLGVSTSADYLLEEIAAAEVSLSKKSEFIVKYCNLKQNSSTAWLPYEVIDAACGDAYDLEQFRSSYCVAGVDLSQTTDLTAVSILVEKNGKLHTFTQFFMPENKIDELQASEGVPYRTYQKQGFLTASGENFVDYHDCFGWLVNLVENYEIYPLMVGYDRYSAQYLIQDLNAYGFRTDDVFQGWNLTPVIYEADGLIRDGKLRLGENNLLKSHFINTAMKLNTENRKIQPVKIEPRCHIDGFVSVIDALTVRQKYAEEFGDQLKNGD